MQRSNAAIDRIDRASRAQNDNHQERVAELAYQLWQDRGSPEGSPEEDWTRAEQQFVSGQQNELRSAA